MKLIVKNTFYLFFVYVSIFIVAGISFYYVTIFYISKDFNQKLYDRKNFVIQQLDKSDSLMLYQKFSDQTILIIKSHPISKENISIIDTNIINEHYKKKLAYRQLKFFHSVKGQTYKIFVRRLLIETESLKHALLALMFLLFSILLVSLFFANNWISKKLWSPFYITLSKIKDYQVTDRELIRFAVTDIEEFKQLNTVFENLTNRLRKDFTVLKVFTENISHEIQTPLAIIKSSHELLLQGENLTNDQYSHLSISDSAIAKLSNLNFSLGLLSKIENSQFVKAELIDLQVLVNSKMVDLENIIEAKDIEVSVISHASSPIEMNAILADILIENLLSNAIKHNIQRGKIIFEIDNQILNVSNSGKSGEIPKERLFERFYTGDVRSLGLGLSIVKEICIQNRIQIAYSYSNNFHKFSLTFSKV